jgi:hypothetical protein
MPGAETCIAAGPLARAVETRLGHAAFAPTSAADVQIEGYVEKRSDRPGWQAHVVLVDRKGATLGQRDLASDEAGCNALEEPLTLMLALIIDPQLLLAGAQREEPPPSSPLSPSSPPPAAPPPAAPPSLEPRRETVEEHPPAAAEPTKRGEVQVGVAFADGLLPDWAMGLSLNEALVLGGFPGSAHLPHLERVVTDPR